MDTLEELSVLVKLIRTYSLVKISFWFCAMQESLFVGTSSDKHKCLCGGL